MNITLPDEYWEFAQTVSKWLAQRAGPDSLRRLWEKEATPEDLSRWASLAELGVGSITLDQSRNGAGLPLWGVMPVVEACGRAALPEPVTLVVSAILPVLYRMDDLPSEVDGILARIADGTAIASVQDGWDGTAPWAGESELIVVIEDRSISVCRGGKGNVEIIEGIDPARRVGRVSSDSIIATSTSATIVADFWARVRVATAATLTGLSDAVLARAIEYAKVREQFNRPIGSFQAVQHLLVGAYSAWEFAYRYVWYAAWAVENLPEKSEEISRRAKALAGDFSQQCGYAAFQVHGAIAYTWEYDLHLWLRRIQVESSHFGTSADHWRWLAENSDVVAGELTFAE
jgi:alkylation response protein AidB-like acyl-CoA dehydrogenase